MWWIIFKCQWRYPGNFKRFQSVLHKECSLCKTHAFAKQKCVLYRLLFASDSRYISIFCVLEDWNVSSTQVNMTTLCERSRWCWWWYGNSWSHDLYRIFLCDLDILYIQDSYTETMHETFLQRCTATVVHNFLVFKAEC